MRLGLRLFIGSIVVVLLGVTVAAFVVWRERVAFETTMHSALLQLERTASVPQFVPPSDGHLSAPALARYLETRAALEVAFVPLEPFPPAPDDDVSVVRHVARAWAQARHTFTFWPTVADTFGATLAARSMSLAEYTWCARRFHVALDAAARTKDSPAWTLREEQRTAFALRKDHTEEELWNSIVVSALFGAAPAAESEIALANGAIAALRSQPKASIADLLVLQVLPEFAPTPSPPRP
ncbi:MAG: hypothetical protein IPH13_16205 [Planctomycetes bacterium]|nr:hypothetical protein [Planctomycetota bacterium]MCC7170788.1 hypothetical protein [Planctomycetota bacterium]